MEKQISKFFNPFHFCLISLLCPINFFQDLKLYVEFCVGSGCHNKIKKCLRRKRLYFATNRIGARCRSHYVKSVQIRSYFWSVFSHIRTEYGDIRSISYSEYDAGLRKPNKRFQIKQCDQD